MLPGRMRDRVKILEHTQTYTPSGIEQEWEESETRWGRVAPVSVQEAARYQQIINSNVTHTVTFRGRVEVSTANRIEWRGVPMQVVKRSYDVDGTGKVTMLAVRELIGEPDTSPVQS